jgi:hypothetical protein
MQRWLRALQELASPPRVAGRARGFVDADRRGGGARSVFEPTMLFAGIREIR